MIASLDKPGHFTHIGLFNRANDGRLPRQIAYRKWPFWTSDIAAACEANE